MTPQQAIIAILYSPSGEYKDLMPRLTVEMFTDEQCIQAFNQTQKVIESGLTPNSINLFKVSKDKGILEAVLFWQQQLTYNEPVNEYLAMLTEDMITRKVARVLTEEGMILNTKGNGIQSAQSIIKKLNQLLDTGVMEDNLIDMIQLSDLERKSYYLRKELAESGKTTGVDTGLSALNKFTGGWQSEFIIIAGRPSMGKTALALYHAMQSKEPGIYFNLEMNNSQLCQRLILQNSDELINSARLRDGNLNQSELHEFERSIGDIERLPVLIYDKARCGIHEATRVMRREHRKGRCKWAIIDYLQLMTIEGWKGGNRELEVAEISRSIKAIQKELGIPVIALAQLSRNVEQRADKKPILSDLRESGSLEQDADTVVFVWRPAYYGLSDEDGKPFTNEVHYLFEKHRQGTTGSVEFRHNRTVTKFFDNSSVNEGSSFLPSPSSSMSQFTSSNWLDSNETEF